MEGQHHKKRAVRIARKGVAPSPHVIHLSREQYAPTSQEIETPSSLNMEVAIDSLRNSIKDRVQATMQDALGRVWNLHDQVRVITTRLRYPVKKSKKEIKQLIEEKIPELPAAVEMLTERVPLRERLANWMSSRITTARVRMGVRPVSLAVFVIMLGVLILPFGVVRAYQHLKGTMYELQEQKIILVALATKTQSAISAGDFALAQTTLETLRGELGKVAEMIDGTGPLRLWPRVYQMRKALSYADRAIEEGNVALAAFDRFPWPPEVFAATEHALLATDQAVSHLGRAKIGIDGSALVQDIRLLRDGARVASAIFGARDARYLLVFQNENELRPTGGFMGSFAVVSLKNGTWSVEMPSQGSYALQGWLTKLERPPEPLSLISERFEFQDVNWFPDFPTSAKKIMSFYEAGGGSTVDGVIAVNSSFLNDVMKLAGPVTVPEIAAESIGDGTVVESLERAIARDRSTAAPKAVMGGLLDALVGRVHSGAVKPVVALATIAEALLEKKIQLYFRDSAVERAASRLGWSGEVVRDWESDYLMVTSANVAGGKTDAVTKDAVDYRVELTEQGEMLAHLDFKRTHGGKKGDALRGIRNVSFVRFYVPHGATLLSAQGFSVAPKWRFGSIDPSLTPDDDVRAIELTENIHEKSGTIIAEESGKTVFGNWLMIDPGETKTVRLTYVLPYRAALGVSTQYSLFAQKQSGRNMSLQFTLAAPGFTIQSVEDGRVKNDTMTHTTELTTDQIHTLRLAP